MGSEPREEKCGLTNHTGCACWEEQRNDEIRRLEMQLKMAHLDVETMRMFMTTCLEQALIEIDRCRQVFGNHQSVVEKIRRWEPKLSEMMERMNFSWDHDTLDELTREMREVTGTVRAEP